MTSFVQHGIQLGLLLAVPCLLAFVLHRSNIRAWSVLGGAVGGLLLSSLVLGAVAPSFWSDIFEGASSERVTYVALQHQQQIDRAAATVLGIPELELKALAHSQAELLQREMTLVNDAIWQNNAVTRIFCMLLIVFILAGGAMRRHATGNPLHFSMLSVGVWSAIIPGGLLAALSYWLWGTSVTTSLAFGATLAAGPWTLQAWERTSADNSALHGASYMLQCGRVAWIVATSVALFVSWQIHGVMSLVWLAPLLLLPCVWMLPARNWWVLNMFVDYVAIPSVMALSLVSMNIGEEFSFWPTLVVILLCADGRWLGGIIGLGLLGGHSSEKSMKLAIPLVDAGISQMCMVALLSLSGVLPASFALAALVGVVFLECTVATRMKFVEKPHN